MPRAAVRGLSRALEPVARARRVVLRQRIGGQMGSGPRCRADAHRHIERENNLAEIVRLARIGVHYVAQRPLQEQQ